MSLTPDTPTPLVDTTASTDANTTPSSHHDRRHRLRSNGGAFLSDRSMGNRHSTVSVPHTNVRAVGHHVGDSSDVSGVAKPVARFNARFTRRDVGRWLSTLPARRHDGASSHGCSGAHVDTDASGGESCHETDDPANETDSGGHTLTPSPTADDYLHQYRCVRAMLQRTFPSCGLRYTAVVDRFANAQLERQRSTLESNTRKIADRHTATMVIDDHLKALNVRF